MTNEDSNIIRQQIIDVTGSDLPASVADNLFRERLGAFINELIVSDFQKLVSILYRLDVNEKKLMALLAERANVDAGISIANAIIARQIEKMASRKAYSRPAEDFPGAEKW